MNELQRELDQVFRMIASVPVSGDGVEIMAAAREGLRRAYRLAGAYAPPAKREEDSHGG